jgi:adenosine deaminase
VSARSTLEFIRDLPKVELHLHLETSLRLHRLVQRQHHPHADPPGNRVPERLGGEASGVADPQKFKGYDRLRRLRYLSRAGKIPDSFYSSDNIEQITSELLTEAAAQRVRHVEVRVGGRRGFSLLGARRMLEAMARARGRAEREQGITCGFLITVVRERGPEEADQRVREAIACRDCGVVGVDLAGDEQNYPPALFARVMDLAREAELGITVHAGEFAGPASIWTAVYQLGARRLGHGIRAAEDPELMNRLRERGVTLELCPTSNLRLGLCDSMEALPIRHPMAAGVPVTVNSDDPMLLGTDISRELEVVATTFALTPDEVRTLVDTASRAAFSPPPGLP